MAILFTDTDCDISADDIKNFDIKVILMPYIFDVEECYYDLTKNENTTAFFEGLRKGVSAVTSAINSQDYINYFEPYFKNNEEMLYVHFSDKMSATFEKMEVAIGELSKKYPKAKFLTFNTLSICAGSAILVVEAAKQIKDGKSIDEIVVHLKKMVSNACCLFAIEDPSFIEKGGRSNSKKSNTNVLKLKLAIGFDDNGCIKLLETKTSMNMVILDIAKRVKNNIFEQSEIRILDADAKANADKMEKEIKRLLPNSKIIRYSISPVVGTHCGPGAVCVAYFGNKRL